MKRLIRANSEGNSMINFEPAFELLNKKLVSINKSLELVCAGGFVMQLHGYRGTIDIDAFYRSTAELEDIIKQVGDEFGINRPDELWLNNSVSTMNPMPPVEHRKVIYNFSNLRVKAVDLDYLIGMKLNSGREQDLKDVVTILKDKNYKQPFDLLSILKNIGFQIDIADLLESFGMAHGMDWLETFYSDNEAKLGEYF